MHTCTQPCRCKCAGEDGTLKEFKGCETQHSNAGVGGSLFVYTMAWANTANIGTYAWVQVSTVLESNKQVSICTYAWVQASTALESNKQVSICTYAWMHATHQTGQSAGHLILQFSFSFFYCLSTPLEHILHGSFPRAARVAGGVLNPLTLSAPWDLSAARNLIPALNFVVLSSGALFPFWVPGLYSGPSLLPFSKFFGEFSKVEMREAPNHAQFLGVPFRMLHGQHSMLLQIPHTLVSMVCTPKLLFPVLQTN